jgi:hypothetical protein
MNKLDLIRSELSERRLILFAGAGVSATLGLPSWSGLINQMAIELGYDPDLFRGMSNYPTLAEHYLRKVGGTNSITQWMRSEWCNPTIDIQQSRTHMAIIRCDFPAIYTTNYDPWLERAHEAVCKPYQKIVSGSDISKVRDGQTQIIKFHGDLESPDTLILTESHYFERQQFEAALDLKIRADLLRYSVLYIGYSLSDLNLRHILFRLEKSRATDASKSLRSFMLMSKQNEVEREQFEHWGINVIYSDALNPTEGLEEFLDEIAGP